jgi:hypothetical protein
MQVRAMSYLRTSRPVPGRLRGCQGKSILEAVMSKRKTDCEVCHGLASHDVGRDLNGPDICPAARERRLTQMRDYSRSWRCRSAGELARVRELADKRKGIQ